MKATTNKSTANKSQKANADIGSAWSGRAHLLDTKDLTLAEIGYLLEEARKYKNALAEGLPLETVLSGKIMANLFYENSTRTRSSFELAGKHLGMHVLNLDIGASSAKKGETLEDTGRTMQAMGVNVIVQRHSSSGSAHQLAKALGNRVHVINAGDGANAHPTQALLDAFTMLEYKDNLKGAKVAIVGDVTHSRVARSNLWLLQTLGAEVHFAGPPTLVPSNLAAFGAHIHVHAEDAIKDADFVMALRLQLERQQSGLIPSLEEYAKLYRLDHDRLRLAKPGAKIMHPGPINRGVEITDKLADDLEFSLIEKQVANGVPIRMSVLQALCTG